MRKNENLKKARIDSGLSQVELAERLGLKQSYISKLERGDAFSYDQAVKIALILGVDAKDILPKYNDYFEHNELNDNNIESDIVASLKEVIKSKDETIQTLRERIEDLKHRLSMYEEKPKTGTN